MATPTPTTRPTTTACGWCAAEREPAGTGPNGPDNPFDLHALWRAYRACRRGKRHSRDTQRYEIRLLDFCEHKPSECVLKDIQAVFEAA